MNVVCGICPRDGNGYNHFDERFDIDDRDRCPHEDNLSAILAEPVVIVNDETGREAEEG